MFELTEKAQFKDILVVEGGTHNDTWALKIDSYLDKLVEFTDKAHKSRQKWRKEQNKSTKVKKEKVKRK